MLPKRGGTGCRELVGAAPFLGRQRLDQALAFEPAERLIQRARRQLHAREVVDVLGQRVAVLRAFGKAGQDERRGAGVAPEPTNVVRCHAGYPTPFTDTLLCF